MQPPEDKVTRHIDSAKKELSASSSNANDLQIQSDSPRKNALPHKEKEIINNDNNDGKEISASDIIAALALIVAFGVGIFTAWNEIRQGELDARQSLTGALEQIADIDRQIAEFQSAAIPEHAKEFASFTFANRKLVLLRTAEALFDDMGDRTTPEDSAIISVGYYGVGEFKKAEEHLKRYLRAADTDVERAVALRSLASLTLVQGHLDTADDYLARAVDELGKPSSQAKLQVLIGVLLAQVQHNIAAGEYDSALIAVDALIDAAHQALCTPDRGQWIKRANSIRDQLAPFAIQEDVTKPKARSTISSKCIYDPAPLNSSGSDNFLNTFTGAYTWNNQRLRVFLWDENNLAFALRNQPIYLLRKSQSELKYSVEGMPGYFAEFQRTATNLISSLRLIQPQGNTNWTRTE